MSRKRRPPQPSTPAAATANTETAAPPADATSPAPEPAADATGGLAPVWKILGGVLVGTIALLVVMVYQQTQSQIRSLRNEVSALTADTRKELIRIGETHGSMMKKDDHQTRLKNLWESVKSLQSDCADLTRLKERCALLAESAKAADEDRKLLADEIRRIRERSAADGERQRLTKEIESVREKIAALEVKAKTRAASARGGMAEEQDK